MDHRRTQSAQARVYNPPQHPPPGAQGSRPYPIASPGLLSAGGQSNYRDRIFPSRPADIYASNGAGSSQYPGSLAGQGGLNQTPPTFAFPEPQLYRSTSAGSYDPRRYERQDTITPDSPGYGFPGGFSEEAFDREQYAVSVMSFSPDHSPSLRGEALAQLRCVGCERT
jgi:hypothetical protein